MEIGEFESKLREKGIPIKDADANNYFALPSCIYLFEKEGKTFLHLKTDEKALYGCTYHQDKGSFSYPYRDLGIEVQRLCEPGEFQITIHPELKNRSFGFGLPSESGKNKNFIELGALETNLAENILYNAGGILRREKDPWGVYHFCWNCWAR